MKYKNGTTMVDILITFKIKITSYKGLDEGILRRLNGLIREYKKCKKLFRRYSFFLYVSTTYQTVGKTSLFPSFEKQA